jgi:hypothetical protein
MFEGKTADCLALANTAILIRLIEQLVERGAIARPNATTLLQDAVSYLQDCPDASRTGEAITIISYQRLACRLSDVRLDRSKRICS